MSFIDCLLLTLINAVLCITLPKVLSLMLAPKIQRPVTSQPVLTPHKA
jgi:hypothetical protein